MDPLDSGWANVIAVGITAIGGLGVVLLQRLLRVPPPGQAVSVAPSAAFDNLVRSIETSQRAIGNSVGDLRDITDELREGIGGLGGKVEMLQDAAEKIIPLSERLAVVESKVAEMSGTMRDVLARVGDVQGEQHTIKHSVANLQQSMMAVARKVGIDLPPS